MKIARLIIGLFLLGIFFAAPQISGPAQTLPACVASLGLPAAVAQDAPRAPDVKIDINKGGDRVIWYMNPTLLLAAGIGVLILLVLLVLASRGNGTTVIKS